MKCVLSVLFATGLVLAAQPAETPAYYQEPYPAQTQGPNLNPQNGRMDMTAMIGALEQAMRGLRRLNDLNRMPPELQGTQENQAARRAAMMAISTSVAAAVGAAADKDHVKGAMIGAAVGGVIAMIAEEAQASRTRRVAEEARQRALQQQQMPPQYRGQQELIPRRE